MNANQIPVRSRKLETIADLITFLKTLVPYSSTITFDIASQSLIIRLIKYAGACPPCRGRLIIFGDIFSPQCSGRGLRLQINVRGNYHIAMSEGTDFLKTD